MSEPKAITKEQVCAMLGGISDRTLERRHEWSPRFPAPLTRRPLTWLESEVQAWLVKRNDQVQREAA